MLTRTLPYPFEPVSGGIGVNFKVMVRGVGRVRRVGLGLGFSVSYKVMMREVRVECEDDDAAPHLAIPFRTCSWWYWRSL